MKNATKLSDAEVLERYGITLVNGTLVIKGDAYQCYPLMTGLGEDAYVLEWHLRRVSPSYFYVSSGGE